MLGRGLRNRHSPHAAVKRHPVGQGTSSGEEHVVEHEPKQPPPKPSADYPVLRQDGQRAGLDRLSSYPDFGFVKVFKDGSGTLHGREGQEIVGFFDIRDLHRISRSGLEVLSQYASRSERLRVLNHSVHHNHEQETYQAYGPVRPAPMGGKRQKKNVTFPMVSHGEAEADLRMLAYFDTFTSVNLNRDGSGSVRSFTEKILERFDDVAGLHAILATQAMKERLQGAGKV